MRQLILPYVSVKCRVLDTDEHGFLDGSGLVVSFLVYYVEAICLHRVSCGGAV